MAMTVAEILSILSLVERAGLSYAKVKAMQEDNVSDGEILAEIERLKTLHGRHQSLDLRDSPQ